MAETIDYSQLSEKAFKIKTNVLFSDGSGLDLSKYIRRTRITNDYINYVMPHVRMVFTLPLDVIMMIQRDRDMVVFALEIQQAAVDFENETDGKGDTKVYESYMKKTILKPLKMDESLFNSDRLHKSSSDTEEDTTSARLIKFELIAVPEDALKSNKYVTSGVFRSANVTEAILALTTKTDYKVYISEPDNLKKYDQMILYPGNIYTNLFHIHNNYGIYNDDLKVYSVNDKLIISPLNSDKILDNRAPISVTVKFNQKSPEGFIRTGSYDELNPYTLKTIKHIITNHHNVSVQNNASLIAEVFGNNHIITSRSTYGVEEENYNSEFYGRNEEFVKTKTYEDVFNNEYTRHNFLNKIQNQNVITVNYRNIDLKIDDGLRKFIMNFDNVDYKKFSGEYKCLNTSHEFLTQTSGLTLITGSYTLRKI